MCSILPRASLAVSLLFAPALAQGPSSAHDFTRLFHLPLDAEPSFATAQSGDGSTAVGHTGLPLDVEAIRWPASGDRTPLGALPSDTPESRALGVDFDGSVVVGESHRAGAIEAFRWTPEGGLVGLGFLPGSPGYSSARACDADGSVIVGAAGSPDRRRAFRWEGGRMTELGPLPAGLEQSEATGVSRDGAVVVGRAWGPDTGWAGERAFRWTAGEGMVEVASLPGAPVASVASAVSADGDVIVGWSELGDVTLAWRFRVSTAETVWLGDLSGGGTSSRANDVSADGAVVVGHSMGEEGQEAFLWTEEGGMRRIEGMLAAQGVPRAGLDRTLTSARAVSDDGRFVVGDSINENGNGEGWRVRIDLGGSVSSFASSTAAD